MKPSDVKVKQLRESIRAIVRRFHVLDCAMAQQPHGELNIAEIHVIEYLGDAGGCMMRELAEFLIVAVNTVTAIVDKLEEKNLVRRERADSDRRIVRAHLTDKGKEVLKAILEMRLHACRTLLTPLNEDEQDIYMVLMRKIARAFDAEAS